MQRNASEALPGATAPVLLCAFSVLTAAAPFDDSCDEASTEDDAEDGRCPVTLAAGGIDCIFLYPLAVRTIRSGRPVMVPETDALGEHLETKRRRLLHQLRALQARPLHLCSQASDTRRRGERARLTSKTSACWFLCASARLFIAVSSPLHKESESSGEKEGGEAYAVISIISSGSST